MSSLLKIQIPEKEWDQNGPPEDPRSQLLVTLVVSGCMLHLEAYSRMANGGSFDGPQEMLNAIEFSADYDEVQTLTIAGREYVLIATPFRA